MKVLKGVKSNGKNIVDQVFIDNVKKILNEGSNDLDGKVRPKYKDGAPSHTRFITQVVEEYDLSKGEFPFLNLRPIVIKKGIDELRWIHQDQSNDLDLLKEKYGITWWDEWDIGDRTIGERYGAVIKKYDLINKLLDGLKNNPYSRRHIVDMWQEETFEGPGLKPCAFMILCSVRDGFLDLTLKQRSNDYLMAGHINKIQYVALQLMLAKASGLKPGKFVHFVQNLHIYDRHINQAKELIKRYEISGDLGQARLILDTDKTDFYEFTSDDFKIENYHPLEKIEALEIAI